MIFVFECRSFENMPETTPTTLNSSRNFRSYNVGIKRELMYIGESDAAGKRVKLCEGATGLSMVCL